MPETSPWCLNTLSGGHPLRTAQPRRDHPPRSCLNTLSGGHPLRTGTDLVRWPNKPRVSIPSQAGTLFGRDAKPVNPHRAVRLNTLSGGHPLRTAAMWSPWVRGVTSQYPLRRAPSSDPRPSPPQGSGGKSQYPLRRAPSSDFVLSLPSRSDSWVSIPSQAGTLFGQVYPAR